MRENPVVCGRRFCASCGRWRLVIDFGTKKDGGRLKPRFQGRCRLCAERTRRSDRKRVVKMGDAYNPRSSSREGVDAAPFLAWLDRWRTSQEARCDGQAVGTVQSVESLARNAGTATRTIRYARRTGIISYQVVDKILIAAGGDTMLWELYPDLYPG